jgi:hypothetical protein
VRRAQSIRIVAPVLSDDGAELSRIVGAVEKSAARDDARPLLAG